MRRPEHQLPGRITDRNGRIVIDLPIDEAWDIVHAFPACDGFARDLLEVIDHAEAWIQDRYGE